MGWTVGCSSFNGGTAADATDAAVADASATDARPPAPADGGDPDDGPAAQADGGNPDAGRCTALTAPDGIATQEVAEGGSPWSSLASAVKADAVSARSATISANEVTQLILVRELHLLVPLDATITGVSVNILRQSPGGVRDGSVRLYKSGARIGAERRKGEPWPATDAEASYGSSADLWGTALSPADVNADGFGVAISAMVEPGSGGTIARVDAITLTVHYCR